MLPSFLEGKSLKELCTIGIGGPAEKYVEVNSIEEMQAVIKTCKDQTFRYFILGKGSNTLFDDRGFKGIVIHNKIDFLKEEPNGLFYAGAGYSFSLLGSQTARKGWGGLEFASGIPGSVGGAVFMNAGANGKETCEHLVHVDFVNEEGDLKRYSREELNFSYRHSSFHTLKGAIVGAAFQLSCSTDARRQQIQIINYRTKTQPYGKKSAGCMFRNSEAAPAGALIDQCGLKGMCVGGAKVSELHANFIINEGDGSAEDVIRLANMIQQKVKDKTGIKLEKEVRFIPYSE